MPKNFLRYAPFLLVFCLILLYSCRKDINSLFHDEPALPEKTEWAKEYYEEILFKKEGNILKGKNNRISGGPYKPNKMHLLWEKSIAEESEKFTFVEVPLLYTRKIIPIFNGNKDQLPDKNVIKSSFSRLVIYKDTNGKINQCVITYVPDKEYLLTKKGGDISHNKLNKLDPNFSGYIQYKKWDGSYIKTLRIEQGNPVRGFAGKKAGKQSASTSQVVCEPTYTIEYEITCYYTGENSYFDYCDAPVITNIYPDGGQTCTDDGTGEVTTTTPGEGAVGDRPAPLGDEYEYTNSVPPNPPVDLSPDCSSWKFTPVGPNGNYQAAGVSGIDCDILHSYINDNGELEVGYSWGKFNGPLYFEFPHVRANGTVISAQEAAQLSAAATTAAEERMEVKYGNKAPLSRELLQQYHLNELRAIIEPIGGRVSKTANYPNIPVNPLKKNLFGNGNCN